jgi:hypothetical protein
MSVPRRILWHIDPLLDNDRETNNEATTITRQQLHKYATVLEPLLESGPLPKLKILLEAVLSMWSFDRPTELSSVSEWRVGWWVSAVGWSELVGEWVRRLLQFSPCEVVLLEARSWGTGIVRETKVRGTSAVETRYQTTTGEDIADWEYLARAVVN